MSRDIAHTASILTKAAVIAGAEGVAAETLLRESRGQSVAHAIVQHTRKHPVDLIVIGTHGRRGLSRALMGSDAEAVVRVPVLLVRIPSRTRRKRRAVENVARTPRSRAFLAIPQPIGA